METAQSLLEDLLLETEDSIYHTSAECPICSAEVPPNAPECPQCHMKFMVSEDGTGAKGSGDSGDYEEGIILDDEENTDVMDLLSDLQDEME